jgi:hypothetical protein
MNFPKLTVLVYEDLLNNAFLSAFTKIEKASMKVGKPGRLPAYDWTFPDSEAKDLAARVFGDGKPRGTRPGIGQRYTLVKSMWNVPAHVQAF